MDEKTAREVELDEKYQALQVALANEKKELRETAEQLEERSEAMRKSAIQNIRELEKPITPQETVLASQVAWALSQVFRLGERLTTELERLYEIINIQTKSMIALEKQLPDKMHVDTEKLVESYQKGADARMASMVAEATKSAIMDIFKDLPDDKGEKDDTRKPS
jgi:predicted HNH restriction endonuclease